MANRTWFDCLKMAGCLDNAQMPNLDNLNLGERRNKVASIVAGVLVSETENFNDSYILTLEVLPIWKRKVKQAKNIICQNVSLCPTATGDIGFCFYLGDKHPIVTIATI